MTSFETAVPAPLDPAWYPASVVCPRCGAPLAPMAGPQGAGRRLADGALAHITAPDCDAGLHAARRALTSSNGGPALTALGRLALGLALAGDARAARALLARIDASLQGPHDDPAASQALVVTFMARVWLEDFARASRLAELWIDGWRLGDAGPLLGIPLALDAALAFRTGHWARALARAMEAARLLERGPSGSLRGCPVARRT